MEKSIYKDMSFVEITHELLSKEKKSISFADILVKIANIKGYTQDHLDKNMAQYYTDLNIDGRFLKSKGEWALKSWFPVDYIDDEFEKVAIFKPAKSKKNKEVDFSEVFDAENLEDILLEDEVDEYLDDEEENEASPDFQKEMYGNDENLFDKEDDFPDE